MFCTKCGHELDEGAVFCTQCGTKIGVSEDNSIDQHTAKQRINTTGKATSKSGKLVFCGVAVLALVIISAIGLSKLSSSSSSVGKNNGLRKSSDNTKKNGRAIDDRDFSLDVIETQCEGCRDALTTYIELVNNGNSISSTKESITALCQKKGKEMHHNCTADVIQVTNIPYAYRGSYGTYTGDWKGAGPVGYGEYTGAVYRTKAVSYKGEWEYGLPNGSGELYVEDCFHGWDMTYKGQMCDGMRDGTGYLYEYYYDDSMYRIYDEATFKNDIMVTVTDCVEYDGQTGDVIRYERMIGDEATGWVNMVDSWEAGELSPEQKKALEFAECALVVGTLGYMISDSANSGGYNYDKANEDMLNELNSYREQKAQEEQEALIQQQKDEESYRKYCTDQYNKLHKQDPTDWSLDAQYFKNYAY